MGISFQMGRILEILACMMSSKVDKLIDTILDPGVVKEEYLMIHVFLGYFSLVLHF